MFSTEQIEKAHEKVKTGAEFPAYLREIRQMGVTSFETWVKDNHTVYFGDNGYQTESLPKYQPLDINPRCDVEKFSEYLKMHQQGQTDYFMFCTHCAETGIEKWEVNLLDATCTYYEKAGKSVLVEQIPM